MSNWIVKYRVTFFIISLLLVSLSAGFISGNNFVNDFNSFFKEGYQEYKTYQSLKNRYQHEDSVLLLVNNNDKNLGVSKSLLVSISTLSKKLENTPYALQVDSILSLPISRSDNDFFSIDYPLQEPKNLTQKKISEIFDTIKNDSRVLGLNISKDNKTAAILLKVRINGDRVHATREIMDHVREVVDIQRLKEPSLTVHLLGSVVFQEALLDTFAKDVRSLVPIVGLLGVFILWLLSRSIGALIGGGVVIVFSIVGAVGVSGLWGTEFNQTSMLSMVLIFIIGLADCVHINTNFLLNLGLGMQKDEALRESIKHNLRPVFLASITTALGFLSLNFNDSPPFVVLGNVTAIGVMLALLFSLGVLPFMLSVLPAQKKKLHEYFPKIFESICDFSLRRSRICVAATVIFIGGSLLFLPQNRINNNEVGYYPESSSIYQSIEYAKDNFSGIQSFYISIQNVETDSVNNTDFLLTIEELTQWLVLQTGVNKVVSYVDILKSLNQSVHDDQKDFYRLPYSEMEANDLLTLYQLSLQNGESINHYVDLNEGALKVTVLTDQLNNQQLIAMQVAIKQWVREKANGITVEVGSRSLMFAHMGQSVIKSMILGAVTALLTITLIMIIGLRSLRYGLIGMVPNILPALAVYGYWGLFVGEIDVAAATAFCISLGIVVDDTLHIINKYQLFRMEGLLPEEAINRTMGLVGPALFTTTLVLTAGLVVISFSGFGPNETIGMMTAPIIVLALVLDFLFLPPLLVFLDRLAVKKIDAPAL